MNKEGENMSEQLAVLTALREIRGDLEEWEDLLRRSKLWI